MNPGTVPDDLIARALSGELTHDDLSRLRSWRRARPENEARYRDLARTWEISGLAAPTPRRSAPPPVEAILAREGGALPVPVGSTAGAARGAPRRWVPRAAAALVLLAAGLGAGRFLGSTGEGGLGGTEFLTAATERATVRLSDGTYTRLGPSSRLRILETPSGREVWLDGSAFFAVAHDPARPFTVRTRSGDAAVLGTRFEVKASDEDLRLVVVEGRVALTVDETRLEVGASEAASVVGGRPGAVERVEDVFALLEGMEGVLLFQDTPLSLVALEVEQRFGLRVAVADEVGGTTVTAAFTDEDPDVVITAVCRIAGVDCREDGVGISIGPGA